MTVNIRGWTEDDSSAFLALPISGVDPRFQAGVQGTQEGVHPTKKGKVLKVARPQERVHTPCTYPVDLPSCYSYYVYIRVH